MGTSETSPQQMSMPAIGNLRKLTRNQQNPSIIAAYIENKLRRFPGSGFQVSGSPETSVRENTGTEEKKKKT